MEYQNGQFISAYTKKDTLFEGKVYTRLDGIKVVLNEEKRWLPINELTNIRVIQEADEDEQDIQSLVDTDIGKCDIDKLSALDDMTLNKVGDNRENELVKSGVKIKKGDYSTRFSNTVKANSLAKDAKNGNISVSTALEKYKQSKDIDIDMRIKNTLKESFEDDDLLDDFGIADYEDNFSDDDDSVTFDDFDDDFNDYDDSYDEDIDDVIIDKQEDDVLFDTFSESKMKEGWTDSCGRHHDEKYKDQFGIEHNGTEVGDVWDKEEKEKIEEAVDKEFEEAFNDFEENVVRYDVSKLYEVLCARFGYEPEKNITDFEEAIFNLEETEVNNRLKELQKTADGRYTGDDRDLQQLYDIEINGRTFDTNPQLVGLQANIAKQTLNNLKKQHPNYNIRIIQHID